MVQRIENEAGDTCIGLLLFLASVSHRKTKKIDPLTASTSKLENTNNHKFLLLLDERLHQDHLVGTAEYMNMVLRRFILRHLKTAETS
jgi:hypothetical protein